MPTPTSNPNDTHRTHNVGMTGTGDTSARFGRWEDEESWWQQNYSSRPYVREGRTFDDYRSGYRYGFESAQRYENRPWTEVEPELRSGWDKYEHRGKSTWEEIKDTVRDAWEHLKGGEHERHLNR